MEKFYSLTMRQIYFIRLAMDEGVVDDYEMQAKLHGKELKRPPKPLKIKKEDKEIFDKQSKELQKRLRKRYYEKQFKGSMDASKQ